MPELRREIDLPRAMLYGIGQILGAGIYAILREAARLTGDSIVLSFLLAATVASFTGLSYAELSSRFPVEEADFVYVHEAFETRVLSEFTAVTRLLVGVIAAATVLRCGLPVNINGSADPIQQPVQGFEAAVVLPAVHVLAIQANHFLTQLYYQELCNTGLART